MWVSCVIKASNNLPFNSFKQMAIVYLARRTIIYYRTDSQSFPWVINFQANVHASTTTLHHNWSALFHEFRFFSRNNIDDNQTLISWIQFINNFADTKFCEIFSNQNVSPFKLQLWSIMIHLTLKLKTHQLWKTENRERKFRIVP